VNRRKSYGAHDRNDICVEQCRLNAGFLRPTSQLVDSLSYILTHARDAVDLLKSTSMIIARRHHRPTDRPNERTNAKSVVNINEFRKLPFFCSPSRSVRQIQDYYSSTSYSDIVGHGFSVFSTLNASTVYQNRVMLAGGTCMHNTCMQTCLHAFTDYLFAVQYRLNMGELGGYIYRLLHHI
jgi:hypothetical protein